MLQTLVMSQKVILKLLGAEPKKFGVQLMHTVQDLERRGSGMLGFSGLTKGSIMVLLWNFKHL